MRLAYKTCKFLLPTLNIFLLSNFIIYNGKLQTDSPNKNTPCCSLFHNKRFLKIKVTVSRFIVVFLFITLRCWTFYFLNKRFPKIKVTVSRFNVFFIFITLRCWTFYFHNKRFLKIKVTVNRFIKFFLFITVMCWTLYVRCFCQSYRTVEPFKTDKTFFLYYLSF